MDEYVCNIELRLVAQAATTKEALDAVDAFAVNALNVALWERDTTDLRWLTAQEQDRLDSLR